MPPPAGATRPPPPTPPPGTFVELTGLVGAPHLNGRRGTVASALDARTGRLRVTLEGDHPRAVRPAHLRVPPSPPPASPLPPLPLARGVATSRSAGFYYAHGNTPPANVLVGIPAESPARVALLAAGDLRSAFYSVWVDRAVVDPPRRVHFVATRGGRDQPDALPLPFRV